MKNTFHKLSMRKEFNLLLLLPSDAIHRAKRGIFKKSLRYAPITLTYLASLVPNDLNVNIKLLDEGVEPLDSLDFDPDIVCISVMTATAPRAYAIAKLFRKEGKKVVLGGVHPTLLPEEAVLHADSVVVGFSERTFPRLLRDYLKNRLKRCYFDNEPFPVDRLPIPNRKLLSKGSYITINTVLATRGCPKNCIFCAIPNVWKNQYYKRPVNDVINEIKTFEGKEVIFIDVHLLGDKEYAIELLKALIPLRKMWFGLTTAEALFDKGLLNLVIKSGCKGLLIGFESLLPYSLSAMRKNPNIVQRYKTLVNILHNNGIRINGTFLFGTDYEDRSIFERTVEFVDRVRIDLPRFSVFTPYPGTPVFRRLQKEGRIIHYDWALYDVEHIVYKPRNMAPEELEQGLHWVWKEAYKLSSILKRITDVKSLFWIALAANLGYKYYAWKLPSYTREIMNDNPMKLK